MQSMSYKVLILDDEFFLGDVLAKALRTEGFQSIAVTDVDSAIEKLGQEKFDIVISDVYLPNKTGQDLFNHALEHFPDLPFIFITGNPNIESAVSFLKKGAYDYLPKPFLMPELVDKVREVIEKARQRRKEKHLVKDLKQILQKRAHDLRIYQDIFKSKKDGLLIIDVDGNIVEVNPGFELMTGVRQADLLNEHISTLNHIFPGIQFEEIRQNILEDGEWKKELKTAHANGKAWIANFSFFPINNEDGQTFAYSAIINDVTSLRKVENALIGTQEAIIFGLARLAEYRDQETGFHLERIRSYSKELALGLQKRPQFVGRITDSFIDNLQRTAPLHDIGKVGIPDHILLKSDKLTTEEFEIMKSHTVIGYQTLNSIRNQYGEMEFLNMGIEVTYCHHEKYDGSGYPRGLKGDEIPLSAQIVAIADMYDALTSQRVYKEAFTHEASLNIMKSERGRHFNPELFDMFLEISDQFDEIRKSFVAESATIEPQMLGNRFPYNWKERETA